VKVVNLRKEKYTHYIGRGTIFGNPFKIGKDGTRKEVIEKYEKWARKQIYQPGLYTPYFYPLGQAISDLPNNAILGCYCKPEACHGDIIIKIWRELHHENSYIN